MKNVIFKIAIAIILFSGFLIGFFYLDNHLKMKCQNEKIYCTKIDEEILKFEESVSSVILSFEDICKNLEELYILGNENSKINNQYERNYYINSSGVFLNKFSSDDSSVFVSGFVPITESLKNTVYFTSPIEKDFKEFIKSNQIVAQIYYNDKNSYNRTYPPVKIDGIIEAGVDLRNYIFFKSANELNNPRRETIVINKPYLDPVGAGWIISVVRPIYFNDDLKGVLGFDISLGELVKNSCFHDRMILVNADGDIVVASDSVYNFLGLSKEVVESYYNVVNEDVFLPEFYNLAENKNVFSREIWNRIKEGKTKGRISMLDKELYYCVRKIEGLNMSHIQLCY